MMTVPDDIAKEEAGNDYSWAPLFKEIAHRLLDYEDRQPELVALLKKVGITSGLEDRDGEKKFELQEIDPFTFFSLFMKYGEKKRWECFTRLQKEWQLHLKEELKAGFNGVPSAQAQKVWLFSFKDTRQPADIPTLWRFFKKALSGTLEAGDLQEVVAIRQVGKAKITQNLFYIDPENYLPIDSQTIPYLKARGIPTEFNSYQEYQAILDQVRSQIKKPFYVISADAWLENHQSGESSRQDNVLVIENGKRIFKVSHGPGEISEEAFRTFIDKQVIVVHRDTKAKGRSTRSQGEIFSDEASVGDYFYLCRGNDRFVLLGKITSLASPCQWENWGEEGWLERSYEIIKMPTTGASYEGPNRWWTPKHNSTFIEINPESFGEANDRLFKPYFDIEIALEKTSSPGIKKSGNMKDLNLILFGPPGTGKTYKLKNEFFSIFTDYQKTQTQQEFFEELVADLAWWQVISVVMLDLQEAKVNEIHDHPLLQAKYRGSNNKTPKNTIWSWLQRHTKQDCPNVNFTKRDQPQFFWKDEKGNWSIDKEIARTETPEFFEILDKYKNYQPKQTVKKRYIFTTFHQSFSYEDFIEGIKPKMESEEQTEGDIAYEIQPGVFQQICREAEKDQSNDYAIFIDEINRGNIANIFGELITLIEEDKRLGAKNEIKVILPYSKKEFGVPPNLHIIGTMNTADRSVEALDTALRRRFAFKPVYPEPQLLKNLHDLFDEPLDLERMLKTINDRLEKLLNIDHTIGHSYFLTLEASTSPLDDLKVIFVNKILPLLQEYFYGDFEKIGMVLGDSFIKAKKYKGDQTKIKFGKGFTSVQYDFEDKKVYEFTDSNDWTVATFQSIYEE